MQNKCCGNLFGNLLSQAFHLHLSCLISSHIFTCIFLQDPSINFLSAAFFASNSTFSHYFCVVLCFAIKFHCLCYLIPVFDLSSYLHLHTGICLKKNTFSCCIEDEWVVTKMKLRLKVT
jgi:hypothetical protein